MPSATYRQNNALERLFNCLVLHTMPILQQLGGDCSFFFEAFQSENQRVQVTRIETQRSVTSETVRRAFGQDVVFVGK